jgi:hypothetical protein
MSDPICTQCNKPLDASHQPHPTWQELWDANERLASTLATLRRERDEARAMLEQMVEKLRCGTACQCQGEHDCYLKAIRAALETTP